MKYEYKVEIVKQGWLFNRDNKKQEKQLNKAGEKAGS